MAETSEDVIVRLRTVSDTAGLDKYRESIARVRAEALRLGATQEAADRMVQTHMRNTTRAASNLGMSINQYMVRPVTAYGAAAQAAGAAAAAANASNVRGIAGVNAGLIGLAARYLSVTAAMETARRSFVGFAEQDAQLRRMAINVGVTTDSIRKVIPFLKDLSNRTGESTDSLLKGFEVLREYGNLTVSQVQAVFPQIARAAQALGVESGDLARTHATLIQQHLSSITTIGKTNDMMQKAANDYKIDVKELVPMMGQLAEKAQTVGLAGADGTATILAMVGAMKNAGMSGSQALQQTNMFLGKLTSPAVSTMLTNDAEALRELYDVARAEGKNPIAAVMNLIDDMLKKGKITGVQLEQAFGLGGGRGGAAAVRVFRRMLGELGGSIDDIKNAAGETEKAFAEWEKSPQHAINRLIASLSNLSTEFGSLLNQLGATTGLNLLSNTINSTVHDLKNIVELLEKVRQILHLPDLSGDLLGKAMTKLQELQGIKFTPPKMEGEGPEHFEAYERANEIMQGGQRQLDAWIGDPYGKNLPGNIAEDPAAVERLQRKFRRGRSRGPNPPYERPPALEGDAMERGAQGWDNFFRGKWGEPLTPGAEPGILPQRFMGGDPNAAKNSFLSESTMSQNIEDRRVEERGTDATVRLINVLERIENLLTPEGEDGGQYFTGGGAGGVGRGGGGGYGGGAGMPGGVAPGAGPGGWSGGAPGTGGAGAGGGMGGLPRMGPGGAPTTDWDTGRGNQAPGNFFNPGGSSRAPGGGGPGGGGAPGAGGGAGGIMTAGEAGITPKFQVAEGVNWQQMDAGYMQKLNSAYDAMSPSEKASMKMNSGYRPATRAEARAMGMSESSSQEDIWERSQGGKLFAAAPPGKSRHGMRTAGDFERGPALNYLQQKGGQHGLTGILGGLRGRDPVHIQSADGRTAVSGAGGGGGVNTAGGPGGQEGTIDRSGLSGQLDDRTVARLAGLTKGEMGGGTLEDKKRFLAGHMNRTMIESGNVNRQMDNGYYPGTQNTRVSQGEVDQFRRDVLDPVMRGEGGERTHNASLGVGSRAREKYGAGSYDLSSSGEETFYTKTGEAAKIAALPRNRGGWDAGDESTQTAGPGAGRRRSRGVSNLRGDEDATTTGGWSDAITGGRKKSGGLEGEGQSREGKPGSSDQEDTGARASGKNLGGKSDEDLDSASGKNIGDARRVREELEKPIKVNMDLGGSTQFGRASMRREADREVREARYNSNSDIGAA